ncbi:MAG: VWA domain-containing protein [Acidobacteria bacterium]|nr:VWA domain-containing protein [Acidobacteriota bacterium]
MTMTHHRRQRRSRAALLALVVSAAAAPALEAQSDPGAEVRYRLRTSVELVLVPVTVKDGQGNLVTGLQRDDFQLLENGEEQPIRYFSVDPFPLSAVILVDEVLNDAARKTLRETLPVLASAFSPEDEFALLAFDVYPREELAFTRDPDQLRQLIARWSQTDGGATPPRVGITGGPMTAGPRINTLPVGPGVPNTLPQARRAAKSIHDAIFAAGMALRAREHGRRRIIFILSDGLNSRLDIHDFKETRDLLLAESVSVYAIGLENARFALGTTVLHDYARVTGGDVYAPMTQAALADALAAITEQARYQYTLVYAARPAPAGREYRRIEVRVRRSGLKLHARHGYFAGLPLD